MLFKTEMLSEFSQSQTNKPSLKMNITFIQLSEKLLPEILDFSVKYQKTSLEFQRRQQLELQDFTN